MNDDHGVDTKYCIQTNNVGHSIPGSAPNHTDDRNGLEGLLFSTSPFVILNLGGNLTKWFLPWQSETKEWFRDNARVNARHFQIQIWSYVSIQSCQGTDELAYLWASQCLCGGHRWHHVAMAMVCVSPMHIFYFLFSLICWWVWSFGMMKYWQRVWVCTVLYILIAIDDYIGWKNWFSGHFCWSWTYFDFDARGTADYLMGKIA